MALKRWYSVRSARWGQAVAFGEGGDFPGVPHGVQLAARFRDVSAGPEHDLTVAGPADDKALFMACSAHWAAGQVMPDSDAWSRISDPRDVCVRACPTSTASTETPNRCCNHSPVRGSRRKRLRAVLGHAVSFWTWRSLCLDQGLTDREAVQAMTALALATAGHDTTGTDG